MKKAISSRKRFNLEIKRKVKTVLQQSTNHRIAQLLLLFLVVGSFNNFSLAQNGDLQIIVEIEGSTCWDTMSGEEFESTVTVQFQGKTYRGCGRALHSNQ